ncbi:MAG TPA: N-acetylmuramoyl-L-alanine amidase-like domain-containing protein [Dissulfurispiraceae bacterium]
MILFGQWTESGLDQLLRESSRIADTGERIAFLSGQFRGVEYRESTLTGGPDAPEELVINLEGVDCFTFIDYIEAMRLSSSFAGFGENLKRVRYQSGKVSFESRNHFFTDWVEFNANLVDDITKEIGGRKALAIPKELNVKEDGTYFLQGIPPRRRTIHSIPPNAVDDPLIGRLGTGDYIGIYSTLQGLDVSHVGILIKSDEGIYFRHASSVKEYRKVVDQDFRNYIKNKPGIVVLRPK